MQTLSDKTLAEHEASSTGKDWLLVTMLGWQEGFGTTPGVVLYIVVAGAYPAGSTVCLDTLISAGYRIEVI